MREREGERGRVGERKKGWRERERGAVRVREKEGEIGRQRGEKEK